MNNQIYGPEKRADGKWQMSVPGQPDRVLVGNDPEILADAADRLTKAAAWRSRDDSGVWDEIEARGDDWRLAKLVQELGNGNLGNLLSGLDLDGKKLAIRAIEQYARHGENDPHFLTLCAALPSPRA